MEQHQSLSYDAYQQLADLYTASVNSKPTNAYYERPGTLSLMPDVAGIQVLDAGCGAGFYTKWFLQHGAQVIGIDFSENMVNYSKALVKNEAEILLADLNQPLDMIPDHSIDLINSSLTLHYLNDLDFTIGEFARIIKPKGYLIFSVHHPAATPVWHDLDNYHETQLVTDIWKGMRNTEVTYFHRPLSAYTEALRRNGFIIEQIIEPQPLEIVRDLSAETYQDLIKKPVFLFFRARYYQL